MPAVTQNAYVNNVAGSKRQNFYNIAGDTGYTLTVGLTNVLKVTFDPGTITAAAVTAGTIPGTSIITFTSSGAFTNTNVEVEGN